MGVSGRKWGLAGGTSSEGNGSQLDIEGFIKVMGVADLKG